MKKIFRSIINISKDGSPTLTQEELIRNYKSFSASKIHPEEPSYITLFTWIESHFRLYKELPSIEYLNNKAESEGSEAAIASLMDIAGQIPYIRSDYKGLLSEKFEAQNQDKYKAILEKTWQIASSGLKVGKKELKGLNASLEYLASTTRDFRIKTTGIKTDSQIRSKEDSKEVKEGYDKRHKDPLSNLGMFSFIDRIDDCFRGVKLGELLIVAAFVAQGKTTMSTNLAYNGIMQGLNGLYLSLEMNFNPMRDLFYVLHTCNPLWYDHPKFSKLAGKLSLKKVLYGELEDTELEFFKTASDDFSNREDYGELFLSQPTEAVTPSSLELEIQDKQAILAEKGKNLDFLLLDYVGLMVQDREYKYGDYNIDLNNIIKRLKNTAINFNNGRGLRVITPFQVNRDGWKEACKNNGVYRLTALSNANEAERSADGVITLFMTDEDKKNGIIKIGSLKNRMGEDFLPFEARIDFSSRKIYDFIQKKEDMSPTDNFGISSDIPTLLG